MSKYINRWIKFKDAIKDTELLLPTTRNTQLTSSNFERTFRLYVKRVRINKNIVPQGLRNNFARRFLLSGGDIYTLSRLLGHSSVTVTEVIYIIIFNFQFILFCFSLLKFKIEILLNIIRLTKI